MTTLEKLERYERWAAKREAEIAGTKGVHIIIPPNGWGTRAYIDGLEVKHLADVGLHVGVDDGPAVLTMKVICFDGVQVEGYCVPEGGMFDPKTDKTKRFRIVGIEDE